MLSEPGRWGEGLGLSLPVESLDHERSPRFLLPLCPGAMADGEQPG